MSPQRPANAEARRADTPGAPESAPARRGLCRRRRLVLKLALAAVCGLLPIEIAARLMTDTSDLGTQSLGRIALRPYRVDEAAARRWTQRWDQPPGHATIVYDPNLGWTGGPRGRSSSGYQTNAQGAVAAVDRTFDPELPEDRFRIVAVGDSFTAGGALADSWHTQLERLRADAEVLNFAVPGYGTDQAVLRYERDGVRFEAYLAMLGIWPENLCRNLNLNRYFLTKGVLSFKPRFILDGGRLRLLDDHMNDRDALIAMLTRPDRSPLIAHEYWFRPGESDWKPWYALHTLRVLDRAWSMHRWRQARHRLYDGADPIGNRITAALADRFARAARDAPGSPEPFIVIWPMRDLLDRFPESGDFPLTGELRGRGHTVVDLMPVFADRAARDGADSVFLPDGHLNRRGHQLAAETIARRVLDPRHGVEAGRRVSSGQPD